MKNEEDTIPPRGHGGYDDNDFNTFKNARERKKDGRFAVGDLIMKRYKVLAELGQGGMGVVYRCLDETAGIEVALKALPPELSHNTIEMEDIKDNFQLVAKLVHQNIAISKQLEKDDSNGNYYLIMECCEGEDLRRWIRRKRKDGELKLEDVLPIIKQVADALDYAHKQKIIHRDIKPGNIMINSVGDIKVLDFGLAAQIHTSMTRVSMAYHGTSGTGPYMAPEQWRGRAQGAPADQYALAVMTYEMLAGHLPFESSDAAVLKQAVLDENPVEIKNVSKNVQDAIKRAMSKEPAERFETCTDFALALSGKKVKSAKKVKKSNPFKWVALVIFLAILGGGGYYFYNQQVQKQQAEKVRQAKIAAEQAEQKRLEAEKAEKARQAKILAEKKKKEAEEKRKKEFFIDENLKLQPQVKNAKTLIENANYDREQTFGKHLDNLKNSYDSAMLALKDYPEKANKFFKAAQKEILWIETNAPLRENAKNLQKQVADQQKKADEFNGSKLAFSTYKRASEKVNQSAKDYEAGNFTTAVSALTQALEDYRKAYSEARNETVKNLLNSSKLAAKQGQWQQSFDHAGAVLKIDSGSAEAQKLQTEAESHLKPTLQIVALLNGKEVSTEITGSNGKKYSTNDIIKDLTENQKYTFSILYKNTDGKLYEGKLALTADWKSLQKKQIILKEYFDLKKIAADEKRGFRFSEDKRTLLEATKDINGEYTIPAGITTIGETAFHSCKNLKSVTIPDSVETIGKQAFYSCENLRSVTIGNSVKTIGDSAFALCKNLQSVTIPDSVETIGKQAFWDCDNLQSVTIPDSVVTIGEEAFLYCDKLQIVTIGNSVKTIGDSAFALCKNLQSVTIPDSVETIGKKAFWDCENLRSVTIGNSVVTIGEEAFSHCEKLQIVTIGNGVKTIGDSAFYWCTNLQIVTIPDSVTTIGDSAFYWCTNLQSVIIPDSVKIIGDKAFWSCEKLQSVSIPKDTVVAENAFSYRTNVTRR